MQQQELLEKRQARKASSHASIADVTAATANPAVESLSDATDSNAAAAAGAVPGAATSGVTPGVRSYTDGKEVWPLRLIDAEDEEQFQIVYNLLHDLPELVHHYLHTFVFPKTAHSAPLKLSASGQDVGGDILADHRVGFSGTPSDLLPLELGSCQYERGSDGAMLSTMCDPQICTVQFVPSRWSVQSLLDSIATGGYHALIDTGALITGMTNLEVAQYLLERGLPDIDGVVFLDDKDRKMILLRRSRKVIPLAACGIPLSKRFAFYDQVRMQTNETCAARRVSRWRCAVMCCRAVPGLILFFFFFGLSAPCVSFIFSVL